MNEIPPGLGGQQMRVSNRIAKAYNNNRIRTIEDLFEATYGSNLFGKTLAKDTAVATTSTGARNIVYGAGLMSQILTEANTFGALPKKPWQKSGYRIVETAARTTSNGMAQGGAIPATLAPAFSTVDITPKTLAQSFEMTTTQLKLAGKDDVVTWEELQGHIQNEFKNNLNRGLHVDCTTAASTNIESIDRVTGATILATHSLIDATDEDIYGLDRSSGDEWADAYVSDNSGTDRYLALSHLDTMLLNVEPYWDAGVRDNKLVVTGYDTALRIAQLLQAQLRYTKERVTMTVNGIKTAPGVDAGFEVASYDGIPIIRDSNNLKDTISRVYMLDLNHTWIGMLQPVTYLESEDYQAIDKFAREGVYYMEAELICDKFKAQGSLRDLK